MTIRARHAINPAHACHSADVLTPTERAVEYLGRQIRLPTLPAPVDHHRLKWGEVPAIAKLLNSIRGKS